MSQKIEDFFTRSMNIIETEINAISSSDKTVQSLLASETASPCITNLKTMIELNIENAGYSISNCVSDSDGIASTAFRSAYATLDVDERSINLNLEILTFPFIGRNIFRQSTELTKRASALYNSRVDRFNTYLTEISAKLDEVTVVYEEQISILDTCFKSIESDLTAKMASASNSLKVCQRFTKS